MSNKTIADYTAAGSIDASNDYFLIESSSTYYKINRNTILGVSGTPADLSTSQSFTNKTLGNTNTVTLKDTLFTLQDDGDTTKQARFQLSGITTGTTRTYTLPNASSTLVDLSTSQTLTNKTLSSPTISGGTIDNTTITVDSISGHTTSTIVTVANMQISNGVINSANAVTSTSIAASAVQPNALQSGTGTGWAWQSYTPTFNTLTIGNGTIVAKYIQIGKTVFFRVIATWGSTTTLGAGLDNFTLPVTSVSYPNADILIIGNATYYDSSAATNYIGKVYWDSTTTADFRVDGVSSSFVVDGGLSSSSPVTWATGDIFSFTGCYEAP